MKAAGLLALMISVPAPALAQAALAGLVHDASAAPLPAVTVAASSPVLIEKVRTTTTDLAGRYRIEGLRPGTYTVTFTLQGWSSLERQGIELTGSLTATVNAELALGPLAETVTVTADAPAVDTHSAKAETSLGGDLVRQLPTVRSYGALLVLVPGVVTNTNDVVTGTATTQFPIHGGRSNEGRLAMDGLTVGSPASGNSATSYVVDAGAAQEVSVLKSGGLGESETAGVVMNIVPQSGSNRMLGSFLASVTGERLQSSNVTPALEAQGLAAATPLRDVYDVSGTAGGPIVRDRAWFFASAHAGGSTKSSASVFYNLNAGDPSRWLYAPDPARRAYSDRTVENAAARLAWQIAARHRITAYWDQQAQCRRCTGATPGLSEPAQSSPEAVGVLGRPLKVGQVRWWSALNPRLFLEAGFGGTYFGVGNFERSPNPTRDQIRVVEQCATGCGANGGIAGLAYRSQDYSVAHTGSYLWQATLSYVTGTHSFKAGYQHTLMTDDRTWFTNTQNLTYRFSNGLPNQLTQSISPWVNDTRVGWDAIFVQDQWTMARLTLSAALRFDRARSWFPPQQEGPSRFLPQAIAIPATRGVDSYKDVSPRASLAYDLFGNGRTAIKLHAGRYLEGAGTSGTYANANPSLRLPQTTSTLGTAGVTRSWVDANRNFIADCDLTNPAAQDLRPIDGDLCGVMSNTNFGTNVLTNSFDPGLLNGWGVRPSDWNVTAAWQQQLRSRASVEVTYIRRWYRGFSVADNRALEPSDLTPYSIVAPVDPRLPDGGGYTIAGLYDVVPEKAGQVDNLIADSRGYGAWTQSFNGVDATVDVRFGRDLTIVGGASTGQTVADNCALRARVPELATTTTGTSVFGPGLGSSAVGPTSPYCRVAYGVLTQVRGLSAYLVPKIDVRVSATFQSKPGPMIAANYVVPNAAVLPSLGRNLSGNAANVTVNLVAPGTMYGGRINQLDLRFGKVIGRGRTRTHLMLDVYNALNSSAVLTANPAFVPGGIWPQPLSILTPRFFRLGVEFGF